CSSAPAATPVSHPSRSPGPSFSLCRSRPLPGLPSFPTRRSSDLLYREIRKASPPKGMLPYSVDWFMTWLPNIHATMFYSHFQFRSEEHTSELQSRENLVCRLLLEKKKGTHRGTGDQCSCQHAGSH